VQLDERKPSTLGESYGQERKRQGRERQRGKMIVQEKRFGEGGWRREGGGPFVCAAKNWQLDKPVWWHFRTRYWYNYAVRGNGATLGGT
jgi:hypothetical protein